MADNYDALSTEQLQEQAASRGIDPEGRSDADLRAALREKDADEGSAADGAAASENAAETHEQTAEPNDGDVVSTTQMPDDPADVEAEPGAPAQDLHDAIAELSAASGNLITFHESRPYVVAENADRLRELVERVADEFDDLDL